MSETAEPGQSVVDDEDYTRHLPYLSSNPSTPYLNTNPSAMSRRVFTIGHTLKQHRNSRRSKSSKGVKDDGELDARFSSRPNTSDGQTVPQFSRTKSSPPPSPDIKSDEYRPSNETAPSSDINGYGDMSSNSTYDPQHSSKKSPLGRSVKEGEIKPIRSESPHDFDLRAPPPNARVKDIVTLSQRLFSAEHLVVILEDATFSQRFSTFLHKYNGHLGATLKTYQDFQKARRALDYANAVAAAIRSTSTEEGADASPTPAGTLNPAFEEKMQESLRVLVEEALPSYITFCLTQVATEYLVREITGTAVPIMSELVTGLAEVFTLVDPNMEDAPVILASEEFYRQSRYSRDDVIGINCRFLQGPKSSRHSISRLKSAIVEGRQHNELILNYRRDGNPFMNLLLIAPLTDDKGDVRYYIGAQIDVSGLIEEGRGLDSFARLLQQSHPKTGSNPSSPSQSTPLELLTSLANSLSPTETSIFTRQHSQTPQHAQNESLDTASEAQSVPPSTRSSRHARDSSYPSQRRQRLLLNSSPEPPTDSPGIPPPQHTQPSALPGVYQNYIMVRPGPSLRITFVSPALRIPGLLQSRFLDHVVGPGDVRSGLREAFEQGRAVTAKVRWLSGLGRDEQEHEEGEGKVRFLSCTPLLGADDEVGVWMVVMVEEEAAATGALKRGGAGGFSLSAANGGKKRDEGEIGGFHEFLREGSRKGKPVKEEGDGVDGQVDGEVNGGK